MATVVNLLLMAIGLVIFLSIQIYRSLKNYLKIKCEVNKMVGPPSFPIIGNIPQAIGTSDQIFENMRHMIKMYGPTFRAWIGVLPCVNTISPPNVEILISTTKNIAKGPIYDLFHCWLGTGLLTSDGRKWHNRRKVLTPSFHFNILLQFIDVFNKHTVDLVENLKKLDKDGADITGVISDYTLRTICETAMGVSLSKDDRSQKTYMDCVKEFGQLVVDRLKHPLLISDFFCKFSKTGKKNTKTCKYLHEFSLGVIKKKSQEYENGNAIYDEETSDEIGSKKKLAMLDVLLSAKYKERSIDDEGIREEVDTFIFEGHDTTSVALCYALMLLANNRKCQDKIHEEILEVLSDPQEMPSYNDLSQMKYMERCIKESLRLYPSVPVISRHSDGFQTSDGFDVPQGCIVNVMIYDMHRRKDIYPDPEKFDPDRFLPENVAKRPQFSYIPFSAGPRNCIGQRFAMLEMKTVLTAIIKNFILEPVDTPETITLMFDLILRTKNGIKVKFVPRN